MNNLSDLLVIDGNDIMVLGIAPSPVIGEILDCLLQAVILEPEKNNREELLELTKEIFAYV